MPASLPRRARGTVYGFLAPAATAAVACAYRDASGEAWRAAVERDFGVDVPAEEAAARYREHCGFRVVNGLQFRLFVEQSDATCLRATDGGPFIVVLLVKNVSDEQITLRRRGDMSTALGVRRLSDGFEVLVRDAPKLPRKLKHRSRMRLSTLAPGEAFRSRMPIHFLPRNRMTLARHFRNDTWPHPYDLVVQVDKLYLIPATRGDFELFVRLEGSDGHWQGRYEGRLPVECAPGAVD